MGGVTLAETETAALRSRNGPKPSTGSSSADLFVLCVHYFASLVSGWENWLIPSVLAFSAETSCWLDSVMDHISAQAEQEPHTINESNSEQDQAKPLLTFNNLRDLFLQVNRRKPTECNGGFAGAAAGAGSSVPPTAHLHEVKVRGLVWMVNFKWYHPVCG